MKFSLQYLAGFVDGEGCFTASFHKKNIVTRIIITNSDLRPLQVFQQELGGRIRKLNNWNQPLWKPYYQWTVSGNLAAWLSKRLKHYLIIKKEHAEIYIKIDKLKRKMTPDRFIKFQEFKTRLTELNKKGI